MTRVIGEFDVQTSESIIQCAERVRPNFDVFKRPQPDLGDRSSSVLTRDDLRHMAALQDLFFQRHFTSHRPVIGRIIVFGKNFIVSMLNRFLKISLVRQVELNQQFWELALSVHQLERRVQTLENNQSGLSQRDQGGLDD
jgi:hypothetical protein